MPQVRLQLSLTASYEPQLTHFCINPSIYMLGYSALCLLQLSPFWDWWDGKGNVFLLPPLPFPLLIYFKNPSP
jgi:hypothetical protein